MIDYIMLGMVIGGMWGAFYLGSRKEKEKIFEIEKDLIPEQMDIPEEVTEDEYQKALKEWPNAET
jgi:hypothetical protein